MENYQPQSSSRRILQAASEVISKENKEGKILLHLLNDKKNGGSISWTEIKDILLKHYPDQKARIDFLVMEDRMIIEKRKEVSRLSKSMRTETNGSGNLYVGRWVPPIPAKLFRSGFEFLEKDFIKSGKLILVIEKDHPSYPILDNIKLKATNKLEKIYHNSEKKYELYSAQGEKEIFVWVKIYTGIKYKYIMSFYSMNNLLKEIGENPEKIFTEANNCKIQ
jgi:hypothetical protein